MRRLRTWTPEEITGTLLLKPFIPAMTASMAKWKYINKYLIPCLAYDLHEVFYMVPVNGGDNFNTRYDSFSGRA